MRVPGWKAAMLAGRWARSRLSGGTLILGYHRVAESSDDPFDLCVSPRHFDEQMEVLRSYARPLTLADLIGPLGGRRVPPRAVAVTFDDGYADFALHAEPTLGRYQIPATVFVISGFLGRRPWWYELSRIVLEPRGGVNGIALDVPAPEGSPPIRIQLDLGSADGRRDAFAIAHQHLLDSGPRQREQMLEELRARAPGAPGVRTGDEVLDEPALTRLAQTPFVNLGSHTASHPRLATLSDSDQLRELRESRCHLEQITGRPVEDLSYPHGSIGSATRRLAREAGYRTGCASVPDVARRGADPYSLPRFWIPDWDGDRFARWLHRWRT